MNEEDRLIDAANAHADLYNDDDRDCIKADVMNAFFAGVTYAKQRMKHVGWRIRVDNEWQNVESFGGTYECEWAKKLYVIKDEA